jgi:hypothetical protein
VDNSETVILKMVLGFSIYGAKRKYCNNRISDTFKLTYFHSSSLAIRDFALEIEDLESEVIDPKL